MKKKKKKKNKLKKKVINFLKSYKAIILALIIIVIVLLTFCNHLMKSSKTYMFSGKSDYVTILNGVINLNYDVKLLEGSDIEYINEQDYVVTEYKIGYYVDKDNTLLPLAIKSGEDEIGLSLKVILSEISAYNIAEPYHNSTYFTKEKIKSLENGLYFIIEAKTADGKEILDKIELSLSKVSK
ncbi:MAG: hypothetical protein PHD03_01110 [Bacilli bacterium]|nr:hypothetical protein [Bacilli bacterium]MDD4406948.1 hypothetical protein [Bacilli bacterium]